MVSSDQQDSPYTPPQRARFRLKWYAVVMAMVGMALVGGGLWWLARPSTMPAQTPTVALFQGGLNTDAQYHLYAYADRRVYEATLILEEGNPQDGKWAWKKGRIP